MLHQLTEYHIGNRVFYTSPAPCVAPHQQANRSALKECLRRFALALHKVDITHIAVLLTEEDMEFYYQGSLLSMYESNGFGVIHFPVPDFGIPKSLESFAELQNQLVQLTETNRILIHCRGGIGRTGLVAAGLIVALGSPAMRAIEVVREKTPSSVETKEQEQFLKDYAQLRGIE